MEQVAVGIATNVYWVEEREQKNIANILGIQRWWRDAWRLQVVKEKVRFRRERFLKCWRESYTWACSWLAPREQFFWFKEPIRLNARKITGKKRLNMHYKTFQCVAPETVLAIISPHVPPTHKAILHWLSNGGFVAPRVTIPSNKGRQIRRRYQSGSAAQRKYEYWVKGKRTAEPYHYALQKRFVRFLEQKGIKPKENSDSIDVQYRQRGECIFCEVKPTENLDPKYAIRIAIGQLLAYQYRHNKRAKLQIVVGRQPKKEDIGLVRFAGMRLAYYDRRRRTFVQHS